MEIGDEGRGRWRGHGGWCGRECSGVAGRRERDRPDRPDPQAGDRRGRGHLACRAVRSCHPGARRRVCRSDGGERGDPRRGRRSEAGRDPARAPRAQRRRVRRHPAPRPGRDAGCDPDRRNQSGRRDDPDRDPALRAAARAGDRLRHDPRYRAVPGAAGRSLRSVGPIRARVRARRARRLRGALLVARPCRRHPRRGAGASDRPAPRRRRQGQDRPRGAARRLSDHRGQGRHLARHRRRRSPGSSSRSAATRTRC